MPNASPMGRSSHGYPNIRTETSYQGPGMFDYKEDERLFNAGDGEALVAGQVFC